MKDLIRQYRMILRRREFEESCNEHHPLLSSEGSAVSFGAINESCATTDQEDEKHLQRAFSFPGYRRINEEKNVVSDQFLQYTRINGFDSSDSSLVNAKDFSSFDQVDAPKTQSSLVTIFAIWNTIMGTSLLAMPWGMERAGLFPGILVNVLIAALCLYTCYLILRINEDHSIIGHNSEVSDLALILLGKWAEILARIFSIVVLIGSLIVYWVLMSNFLYNSVQFLYTAQNNLPLNGNETVICPKKLVNQTDANVSVFGGSKLWDLYSTVPVALAVLMFPLLNFKSPTFFTKFNSLGTLSVMYLLVFVAVKSFGWGINMNNWEVELNVKPTFCALSGMLSLSYFIHNIIISIMRNNRNQKNNTRDLSIAFVLVTFTYMFIGVIFYICFPLAKNCIEDNILNNFEKFDTLTIIARTLLLFQLVTVFPLIAFMLRTDIFKNLSYFSTSFTTNFSYTKVILVNVLVMTICILFACFLPKIGTLIRYTGALSGLVYIFLLPSLMKIASLRKKEALTPFKLITFASIVIFGFVNLISQFLIVD